MKARKIPKSNFFEKVYIKTKKIPCGKVTTYGVIANSLGTKDARKVGWALHVNKDPKVPCQRVVNKNGKVSDSFGMGGWEEQKKRLLEEGVGFIDEKHVDLRGHLVSKL
ncbi:MGMT family protein [Patescibacteria group bacterium]